MQSRKIDHGQSTTTFESTLDALAKLNNEVYVLDMTRDLTWLSFGLLIAGIVIVGLSDFFGVEMEITHWLYTTANLLSVFSGVIVYVLCITREFWMRPWNFIREISTLQDDIPGQNGDTVMNSPFDKLDMDTHKNIETYVIVAFVFQFLYLAAHFSITYGPLARKARAEVDKAVSIKGKAPSTVQTKQAMRVKYAPLITVSH